VITLRNIRKLYRADNIETAALADVNLQIDKGEFVAVMGPSGCGKSTLLNILGMIDTPTSGQYIFAGEDVAPYSESRLVEIRKRHLGFVFQSFNLIDDLTVYENVELPLLYQNVARAKRKSRVREVLELVDLRAREKHKPGQLSGGQQQRVAVARALAPAPALLLFDEPFSNLDADLREQVRAVVQTALRATATTALFVTHDQEEALVLSDRIAVMSAGRIEQLGTPEEIYAHPVNWFVADFVGESNLFRGRLDTDAAGKPFALMDGGARIVVPSSPFAPGSEVGVLVRPERPRLLAEGQSADNVVRGRIVEVIYVGESVKYRLRIDATHELLVRWPFRERGGTLVAGDDITVGWSVSDAHLVAIP
jgi:ABC-type Fe3+/spermidine/putrescine transport system ATPase subunit